MSEIHITLDGKKLTQAEFNEIELYVLKYFESIWSEIKKSVEILREEDSKFIKSEVCLGFIGADALSRFREIVTTGKEEKSNEKRLREWFDDFVFNNSNDIYAKYKEEINCDSATAWKLRNSLLHFYGLPRSPIIGFGTLDPEKRKEFEKLVSKNHNGKHVIVVNPYRLLEVILHGLLTQLASLKEMIKGDDDAKKEIYARGIVQCYEIIQNEGTVFISFEK